MDIWQVIFIGLWSGLTWALGLAAENKTGWIDVKVPGCDSQPIKCKVNSENEVIFKEPYCAQLSGSTRAFTNECDFLAFNACQGEMDKYTPMKCPKKVQTLMLLHHCFSRICDKKCRIIKHFDYLGIARGHFGCSERPQEKPRGRPHGKRHCRKCHHSESCSYDSSDSC